ncbi:MAG TPA: TIGR02221 family CRISPR-associated protein [Anaerolineae bacterium]|nr:TIGR02221 family CRISPR-associated protein [Anaerolineae bacterium]HQK14883.1 TIGR02221 family CRISPR-associated protein [Anaerolineae bacterium]
MKAISFLGITDYKETTYVWEGHEFRTRFFGETLPHFFPELDRVLVFVTPTVQQHSNLAELQHRLGGLLHPVPIPEGHSEGELWEIFDALTGSVSEQEMVIFDITNSFRSIPLLVFLAAAYLRTARRVKVHRVIYGAWEARDKEVDHSPVFDLTPFVTLLDWLTATNQFIYTGDARYLAHLLTAEGQKRGSNALKEAGEHLQDLSLGMMLCRPLEVMEQAGKTGKALAKAETDLAQWAHPFGLLTQRIQEEYAARALRSPTAAENVEQNLRHQFALIRWYLDNNQVIQAMTLAREWGVTVVGWKLGRGFLLDLKERAKVEQALSGLIRIGRVQEDGNCFDVNDLNDEGRVLWEWPEREVLCDLWNHLTAVRNELDHAGMNPGPMKAAKLVRKAREEVWPRLEELARTWGLGT